MRRTAILALAIWLLPTATMAMPFRALPGDLPNRNESIALPSRGSGISEFARRLEVSIGPPAGLHPIVSPPPRFELSLFDSDFFEHLASLRGWDAPRPRAKLGRPPVPEPSTAALMALGLVGLVWWSHESRSRSRV